MKTVVKKFTGFVKKYWTFLLIIALVLGYFAEPGGELYMKSTGSSYEYDYSYAQEDAVGYATSSPVANERYVASDDNVAPESYDQKIIKTGSLTLHMDDVRESAKSIEEYVGGIGGSVLNSSVTRGDSSYSGYITVRVPADQFDTAIEALKEMAVYVDYEYTNADDVTEAYMDLEARLHNYQAEEEQYLSILNKATTVQDILSVTSALSNVRYQIESLESSISYYDTRVAYSTIDLTLGEDDSVSAVTGKWRPISTIRDAFSDWISFLQGGVDWVIYVAIFAWPLVLVYIVWRVVRKRKK